MDFGKLFSSVTSLAKNETVKKAAKTVATNKKARGVAVKATKVATKVAKTLGIDMATLLSLAAKNADVINSLAKIGEKKGSDPASSTVQKLVSSLKTKVAKVAGTKIDDNTFKTLTNKLLSNETLKKKVEKISGSGVATFIKKAVAEYVA